MERLKQKVASSSSRVIASLQQAATGTFQQQPQAQDQQTQPQQFQQQQNPQVTQSQVVELAQPQDSKQASSSAAPTGSRPPPSTAWMMAADATAHLTEQEREILLEVFKKEEQFQRDTIKQLSASRALQQQQQGENQIHQPPTGISSKIGGPQSADKENLLGRLGRGGAAGLANQQAATSSSIMQSQSSTTSTVTNQSFTTATPTSRPGSSLFGTPVGGQRAASSCSTLAGSGSDSAAGTGNEPLGQCRICRKSISSSELCHLCSNCNQFICEDCASYSASEQHWMCSSCRRRTMSSAIPADALKELGIASNSSAVRRMTLRMNQNDPSLGPQKNSGESTGSSNSSSGCSSMSSASASTTTTAQTGAGLMITSSKSQQRRPLRSQQRPSQGQQQGQIVRNNPESPSAAQRQKRLQQQRTDSQPEGVKLFQRRPSISTAPAYKSAGVEAAAEPTVRFIKQQRPPHNQQAGSTQDQRRPSAQVEGLLRENPTGDSTRLEGQKRTPQQSVPPSGQLTHRQSIAAGVDLFQFAAEHSQHQQQAAPVSANWPPQTLARQQQQPQQSRRASVAISPMMTPSPKNWRKQSIAFINQNSLAQYARGTQLMGESSMRNSLAQHLQQFVQPQTTVTAASSEMSMNNELDQANMSRRQSRRDSQMLQMYQHVTNQSNTTLIPVPPDQIHLRRLSDQSNLVRRSSIIADTIDTISLARNRSHSEIDSMMSVPYFQLQQQQQQQQYGYSDENLTKLDPNAYAGEQRRLSDQWEMQQHQIQLANAAPTDSYQLCQQRQHRQPDQPSMILGQSGQQISSIITSYAQKQRDSTDDLRSTSSSDIDETDTRNTQTVMDHEEEQQHQPATGAADYCLNQRMASVVPQMSIPSVSVSEFHTNQQKALQQQQAQLQQHYDPILTTPMQINVAIEQAIQQQQQQQSAYELSPSSGQMVAGYLLPRRGSSGRVLPKIPGEQSRSLLDLPQNGARLQGDSNDLDGRQHSTLDLPSASPTIRRASAPEGQNIKIVVDDIDNSVLMGGHPGSHGKSARTGVYLGAKQGELLERIVLYRDDSLEQSNATGRGFGLHVTGGKIDETDGRLFACVSWVLPGGPSDKVGLRPGDRVIEWDGKCLVDMTYEQVAELIEDSANIAELLVKPARKLEPQSNLVRSQRRLSQQTERDLRKFQQQDGQHFDPKHDCNSNQLHYNADHRRLSGQFSGLSQQNFSLSNGILNGPQHQQPVRAGTGRRLPQIPGVNTNQDSGNPVRSNCLISGPIISKAVSSSTGQIDHTGRQMQPAMAVGAMDADAFGLMTGSRLSAAHDQQSRSANELYNGYLVSGHKISVSNMGSNMVPVRNGISSDALNSSNVQQQHWSSMGQPQQTPQQQLQPHHMINYTASSGGYSQYRNYSGNHLGVGDAATSARDEICGLIGLQVNVDERASQLEISVLSAINIDRDLGLDYYVKVKILPESNNFKPCTTQLSSDLNWKETFLFQNFPVQQVHRMALEIGIWVHEETPRLSTQMAQPICEALIPIQSACERNTDFWPLRPPPTSPQARRKSLNDILVNPNETNPSSRNPMGDARGFLQGQPASAYISRQPSYWTGNDNQAQMQQQQQQQQQQIWTVQRNLQTHSSPHGSGQVFVRERSASNRNLPDTSKLQSIQPRRASDEVAASSSHRITNRLSPAASRRSISVMNVQGDSAVPQATAVGLFTKPSSRLGSQGNIALLRSQVRRDSNQAAPSRGSPVSVQHSSPMSSRGGGDAQTPAGVTSSGRRSSLAGIQSMAGYRSQKNSVSDEKDAPSSSPQHRTQPKRSVGSATPQKTFTAFESRRLHNGSQHESPASASPNQTAGTSTQCSSGATSRRNSNERTPQLQRRGSFAKITLQKFKRTMSLTKGPDRESGGSGTESRRSSGASSEGSEKELGATRQVPDSAAVGKIKLSFVMTKGQFELEVICVQGLKFEQETTLGVYVKTYLKGKGKSNKRKTRIVQAVNSPIFRHLIKYDGSLIDNKTLEVSVWLKQTGRKGKSAIGFTELRFSDLNLAQTTTSWYNLRPVDSQQSSSVEECP